MLRCWRIAEGIGIALISLCFTPSAIAAPIPTDQSAAHIESLIDQFASISKESTFSINFSFADEYGFAALDQPRTLAGALNKAKTSDDPAAMRDVVRIGVPALPCLLSHLKDKRPTGMVIKRYRENNLDGGFMYFSNELEIASYDRVPDPMRVTHDQAMPSSIFLDIGLNSYTLTVGDLCFDAIGQIVNRSYSTIRYEPSAFVIINSPTHTPALADAVVAEWNGLTPQQHRDTLIRDAYRTDGSQNGAIQRLCYYYPEIGERVALALLHRPIYDPDVTDGFITQHLIGPPDVHSNDRPEVWKSKLDEFVKVHGAQYGDAVRIRLSFYCSRRHSPNDKKAKALVTKARKVMSTLFPDLDMDRPSFINATTPWDLKYLIASLNWYDSKSIDAAVVTIMDQLGEGSTTGERVREQECGISCVNHLSTRGYSAECRQYCQAQLDYISHKPEFTDCQRDKFQSLLAKLN